MDKTMVDIAGVVSMVFMIFGAPSLFRLMELRSFRKRGRLIDVETAISGFQAGNMTLVEIPDREFRWWCLRKTSLNERFDFWDAEWIQANSAIDFFSDCESSTDPINEIESMNGSLLDLVNQQGSLIHPVNKLSELRLSNICPRVVVYEGFRD